MLPAFKLCYHFFESFANQLTIKILHEPVCESKRDERSKEERYKDEKKADVEARRSRSARRVNRVGSLRRFGDNWYWIVGELVAGGVLADTYRLRVESRMRERE